MNTTPLSNTHAPTRALVLAGAGAAGNAWQVGLIAGLAALVTFRKSGEGVPTAVWVARDGDSLIVTTVDGTGKVKRIRNDSRVQLAPCSVSGKVASNAVWVDADATVEAMTSKSSDVLAAKYKLAYRLNEWMRFRKRKADAKVRVIVRIT
jgi:PPOX class probable F420-dependent enzyme